MVQNDKGSKGFTVTDRRFWVDTDEAHQEQPSHRSEYPTYVEELQAKLQTVEEQLRSCLKAHRTGSDEMERFKERIEREKQREVEHAKGDLVASFFELFDNLERSLVMTEGQSSLEALHQGMKLIHQQFAKKLTELGLEVINPENQEFNPLWHEAISTEPVTNESQANTIVHVYQIGFKVKERVLRPARVVVARYDESSL